MPPATALGDQFNVLLLSPTVVVPTPPAFLSFKPNPPFPRLEDGSALKETKRAAPARASQKRLEKMTETVWSTLPTDASQKEDEDEGDGLAVGTCGRLPRATRPGLVSAGDRSCPFDLAAPTPHPGPRRLDFRVRFARSVPLFQKQKETIGLHL